MTDEMMKKRFLFKIALVTALTVCTYATGHSESKESKVKRAMEMQGPIPGIKPAGGFLPDKETALAVAEAILRPILGQQFNDELPLEAIRKADVWIITGKKKSPCKNGDEKCFSFGADPIYMEIQASDSKVIKVVQTR